MAGLEFSDFRDRLAWMVVVGLIAWVSYISTRAIDSVSRPELHQLMEQLKHDMRQEREESGPYVRDKQWIHTTLSRVEQNYHDVGIQLAESNREIRALRIEIEKLMAKRFWPGMPDKGGDDKLPTHEW